jgi:hypothetical protein
MILLLSSDLMFQSRISSSARALEKTCVTDRSVAKLVERVSEASLVRMVLIDLTLNTIDLAIDIPTLKNVFPSCKIIAYGPHVDVERLQLAQESGAHAVFTRGQMDRDMTSILEGA